MANYIPTLEGAPSLRCFDDGLGNVIVDASCDASCDDHNRNRNDGVEGPVLTMRGRPMIASHVSTSRP